jgi:catechol 2,3-dioxygenase-like lactoylglutathione lyase family enzyme
VIHALEEFLLDSVIIYSADLERSKKFYENMGLRLEYREADYLSFQLGGGRLGVKLASVPEQVPGRQVFVVSPTGSLKAVYDRFVTQGAAIDQPYAERAWGITFSMRDPDGNKIEFLQRP